MKGQVFEFFFSLRDSDAQFDMGTADHGGASSWTARYVTVLSQARWLVLASWALLSVLAAWQGPLFLSECVMRMPPETWTRIAALSQSGGLVWMVPVMTFTIVVGLAVDYDVFLLTRVLEDRKLGYSDRDAVVLAQAKTGHVITTAGTIMAVSLGGLIFSSLPGMNQWSFVLAVSVVVDTVFVRSMLVPAVMGVLNQHNWWPLELPAVSIREARLDFEE